MNRPFFFLLVLGTLLLDAKVLLAQPRAYSIDSLKVLLSRSQADTNRVNWLIELARSYVMKPGEAASDLDTALLLVRQGYFVSRKFHYKKGEGNAYLVGAQAYREKGDLLSARRFGQTAVNRFAKYNYIAELAAAHMELGNAYYSNSGADLNNKITEYERALPLFRQVGQKEREATTLRKLAEFYFFKRDLPKVTELLKQSLVIYRQINFPDLHGVYDLLSNVYINTGDFKVALEYGLLALKTAERRKDKTIQLCTINNSLGLTYFKLEDYQLALQYFKRALEIAIHHHDMTLIAETGQNVANAYNRLRQFQQSNAFIMKFMESNPSIDLVYKAMLMSTVVSNYKILNQLDQAHKPFTKLMDFMIQLRRLNREEEAILFVSNSIIGYYIATHQLKQAASWLTRLEEAADKVGAKPIIAYNQLWHFKIDSARGNYLSAIRHFKQYMVLKDSLSSDRKNKEIARLNVEFETEKKEQQLQLNRANIQLLQKTNQIQQSSLLQQANQRNSLIVGSVLLTLLLGLTFNRYRLKQRSNQQLEAKQLLIDQKNESLQQLLEEREWMLKEIHHRVKNNLQVISSMLNSQFNFLQDASALTAIRESQNRVQVMALIHQKLYQTDNLAKISMKEYIHEIVEYIIESFDRFDTVHTQLNIADATLDVSQATPLGLIINEAVTNSLKYAFPQNGSGTVSVELRCLEEKTYLLVIRDNGSGLPAGFDVERSNTLGLTMIRGLSKQIKGKLAITNSNGVEISLQFKSTERKTTAILQPAKSEG